MTFTPRSLRPTTRLPATETGSTDAFPGRPRSWSRSLQPLLPNLLPVLDSASEPAREFDGFARKLATARRELAAAEEAATGWRQKLAPVLQSKRVDPCQPNRTVGEALVGP